MEIYFFIFLFLSFFSFLKNNQKVAWFILTFLFFFASFRGIGVDRDYQNYLNIYNYIASGLTYAIEPTFIVSAIISKWIFDSPWLVFAIFAFIGVYYKGKFIISFSPYIMLSILVYFCNIFFLHEMTQIRVGAASAIGFYSLKFLIDLNKRKFILGVFIASLFHFSMIIFLVCMFFNIKKIDYKYKVFYFSSIILFYVLYATGFDIYTIIQYVNIPLIQSKLSIYKAELSQGGESVNVFSSFQLLHIVIVVFICCMSDRVSKNSTFILFFKIYSLSPLCLIFFAGIPGFSLRLSELFSVSEIILLPMIVTLFRQKKMAVLLVITLSLFTLILNLFHSGLIKEYHL